MSDAEHSHGLQDVVGVEERLQELQAAVEALQARAGADQAVVQAAIEGRYHETTVRAITAVLRRRAEGFAGNERTGYLAAELYGLADDIEGEAGLT